MTDAAAGHPVLDFGGRRRISRSGVVSENAFDSSGGLALANELERIRKSVDNKVGDQPKLTTLYYVTYEVVLDDDGGPGRPMRPPVAGTQPDLVFTGMSESSSERAAA